jgi:hypothetical protein
MPTTTQKPAECPECGQPAGECYNLCPLSPVFYSSERERADEANWSRADYYREAGFDDPDSEYELEVADYFDSAAEREAALDQKLPGASLVP